MRHTPRGLVADRKLRQAESLAKSDFLPQGAYTSLRTYGGTGLILLDKHFDRLEESARLLGHPIQLDRAGVRHLLCTLLRETCWEEREESRVRLTMDCSDQIGDLWISLEPLSLPTVQDVTEGVAVLTRPMHRENPLAKDNAFIARSQEAHALIGGRINEVLMVGPTGRVLEGLSSNFFGVQEGLLYTADEGVLPGLTRSLVLEEVERAGIPLRLEAILLGEVETLDEAFISSSSRGVLPVVEIDGQPIGIGKPGPVTQLLRERYEARLQEELEWVCDEH
ncbi:MAG: aminotransferase class IV [Chloroflexota bacterium]|nr:aminotransferase class IV [Chloroflexota bacterium]